MGCELEKLRGRREGWVTEFYLNNMELALDYRIYKSYRVV